MRWKLRQPDRQNGLVQEPEIIEAIRGAVHSMGPRLLLPAVWVTGLVTITAGSEDTTLPTTASTLPLEYDTVWWLRLTSNGDLLEKVRVGAGAFPARGAGGAEVAGGADGVCHVGGRGRHDERAIQLRAHRRTTRRTSTVR